MIVRSPRPESHFTILSNDLLRCRTLSLRARGLLAMLLSYPDNWRTSAENLAKVCVEGRDAIRSALAELEAAGYIRRQKTQDEEGRWSTATIVYDTPQPSPGSSTIHPQPATDNQASETQASKEELTKKDGVKKSAVNSRVRRVRVCGQCSGTGWKIQLDELTRCDCDAGIRR
jgi:hypothetical protein